MRPLSRNEASMLRYWAINMVSAGYRWVGFDYEEREKQRFAAIKQAMPADAYQTWTAVTVMLYVAAAFLSVGLFFGPLLFFYPPGTPIQESVLYVAFAGMLISLLTFALPLAMAIGGRIADRLNRAPAFVEAEGDAALYAKVRMQIGRIALIGVVVLGLLNWITWAFDVDLTRYDAIVHWSYFGILAAQGVLGYLFVRERT